MLAAMQKVGLGKSVIAYASQLQNKPFCHKIAWIAIACHEKVRVLWALYGKTIFFQCYHLSKWSKFIYLNRYHVPKQRNFCRPLQISQGSYCIMCTCFVRRTQPIVCLICTVFIRLSTSTKCSICTAQKIKLVWY